MVVSVLKASREMAKGSVGGEKVTELAGMHGCI